MLGLDFFIAIHKLPMNFINRTTFTL